MNNLLIRESQITPVVRTMLMYASDIQAEGQSRCGLPAFLSGRFTRSYFIRFELPREIASESSGTRKLARNRSLFENGH